MPGSNELSKQTQLKRENLQLQQIIDEQRKEMADMREYVDELRAETAARIDALDFALRARVARMQNAVEYLTCSERMHPQKIAMALQELRVRDAK